MPRRPPRRKTVKQARAIILWLWVCVCVTVVAMEYKRYHFDPVGEGGAVTGLPGAKEPRALIRRSYEEQAAQNDGGNDTAHFNSARAGGAVPGPPETQGPQAETSRRRDKTSQATSSVARRWQKERLLRQHPAESPGGRQAHTSLRAAGITSSVRTHWELHQV